MDKENHRLADLIDAENAQLAILPELLIEIAKVGAATVERVYGDFTCPANLWTAWKSRNEAVAIAPNSSFV